MSLEDIKSRFEGGVILNRDFYALIAIAEAAKEFYGTHECLGWGGHKGLGEALAALEKG